MTDRYNGQATTAAGPYSSGFAITPADDADLAEVTSAVHVGGAGALHVLMADASEVTLAALPVGIHRLRVRKVFATSTTATNIVGLL